MRVLIPYFFLVVAMLPLQSQEKEAIDSLRITLSLVKNQEDAATLNLALYKRLMGIHSDSAQLHLDRAVTFTKKDLSSTLTGKILAAQVERHLIANNYDSVFHYVHKALRVKKHLGPKLLIDVYSMLGTAHYYKSEYAKAIAAHRRAEKVCISNNLEGGMAKVFNNIGITYIKMENWPKAKEFMTKSFDLCKKHTIERGMAFTLGNLGIINKHQGDFKEAIEAYEHSNKLLDNLNDERGMARNYDNLGALYEELGNHSFAQYYYLKSLNAAQAIGDESTMTSALHNLGNLYAKQGDFAPSIANYEKSLAIAEKLDNRDVVRDNHLGLANVYERSGSPLLALQHQKSYTAWKDSIINQEHLKDISELEIKYESEKKENDILLLSQQKLRTDAKLAQQRARIRRLSYGLLGVTIILGAGIMIIMQYHKNRKQRQLIETIAETQIAERHRIARDLHDSIGGSLALAKNTLQCVSENQDEKNKNIQDSIQALSQTANDVRRIAHNLMPGELVKFGLVPAIHTTLEDLKKTSLEADLYTFNMEERINPNKEIHLFRIIQEAVQNVIKHAQADQLNISLNKHRKYLSLMVEDNGIGIDSEKTPSGIGIENIKSRVSQLKGTLNIDSVTGRGTIISIQIPM